MTTTQDLLALRADLTSALNRVDQLLDASSPTRPDDHIDMLTLDRTVAIETVLRRRGTVMRPVEIWADLRDSGRRNDPKMEVQVTTYDLWQRGRIDRVGRGQYKAKSAFLAPPEMRRRWSTGPLGAKMGAGTMREHRPAPGVSS